MQVQSIGSNKTELEREDGTRVLFSYSTPVAAYVVGVGYLRTSACWSKTTSRHINSWVGAGCKSVPQSEIEKIAGGTKSSAKQVKIKTGRIIDL